MCTLTLAWRAFPDSPVVVAANRDEATDRPSTPPSVRTVESNGSASTAPRILAPRDERAGGTWIGVNEHGVFAGITNRWVDVDLEGARSRGRLVGDALAEPTAEDAVAVVLEAVDRDEYDGFNLVVADDDDAVLLEWDGSLSVTHFDPGIHVVVNVGSDDDFDVPEHRPEVGDQQSTNARRARSELAVRQDESADDWLARARSVLGDHEYGLCIHGDGFGTRSSSLIVVREHGDVEYDFADGPPCEAPFEPVVHDL